MKKHLSSLFWVLSTVCVLISPSIFAESTDPTKVLPSNDPKATVSAVNPFASSDTQTPALEALPAVCAASISVPSATVCVGSPVTITSSIGDSYNKWLYAGTFTSTAANPSPFTLQFTPGATGVLSFSVTVIVASASCTATASATISAVQVTASASLVSPTGTICPGNTIALSASGGSSYAWAGPNSFSSTNSTPSFTASTAATGTYTVTVTGVNSCTNSATVSLSVTAPPTPTVSAPATVCQGETLNLTAGGGSLYSWNISINGGVFTSTTGTPLPQTYSSTGSYSYTVTVSATTGCTATATTSVSVKALPTATVSIVSPSGTICSGQTVSLSVSGGGTYSWNKTGGLPGGFTATSSNPSFTASTSHSGTYTVTVTGTNSCTTSATLSLSVAASPSASVSVPTSVCQGQSLNLTAGGGDSYSWNITGGFTGTSTGPSLSQTFSSTGAYNYTVTVAGSAGCTATATTSVSSKAPPSVSTNATSGLICPGNTVSLTATGGGSYAWAGPNSFSSTSGTPSFTGSTSSSGIYSVTVTGTNSCTASATVSVSVTPPVTLSISSNTPLCEGTTISLSANAGGPGTFNWSGPASFSNNTQAPSISNATTNNGGVYSVTLTGTAICSNSATASVRVSVPLSKPNFTTASGKFYLCANTPLTLIATPNRDDVVYTWIKNTAPMANSNTYALPITEAGPYEVQITGVPSIGGCSGTFKSVQKYITPGPAVGQSVSNTVTAGSIVLEANPPSLKYAWTGPASFSSTLRKPTISSPTTANAGVYTVNLLVPSTGCTASATTAVVIGATRLASPDAADAFELTTYPNPTDRHMNVGIRLTKPGTVKLRLTNVSGVNVEEWLLNDKVQNHETSIDLSRYMPGTYILQAESNNKRVMKKVLRIE